MKKCGFNADWCDQAYHIEKGEPNRISGDHYLIDDGDKLTLVSRYYRDDDDDIIEHGEFGKSLLKLFLEGEFFSVEINGDPYPCINLISLILLAKEKYPRDYKVVLKDRNISYITRITSHPLNVVMDIYECDCGFQVGFRPSQLGDNFGGRCLSCDGIYTIGNKEIIHKPNVDFGMRFLPS